MEVEFMPLQISSHAFENGGRIPSRYTCDGEGVNPPLEFSGTPEEAKSLVLIMEDPDVPTYIREDGIWDHWLVFNIPPETSEIKEGEEPLGVHGAGTAKNLKYHRPCPPDREHRYFFRLFALDEKLSLSEGAFKKEILEALEGHVLEKSEMLGVYQREK